VRRIVGKTLISAYTDSDFVTSQLLQIVKPFKPEDTKYLLGILNSKLLAYYFRKKYNRQDKTFPEIRIYELCSLPIKRLEKASASIRQKMAKYADDIINLKEENSKTKLQSKKEQLDSKIDFCEDQINNLVYEIYGLTKEEIKLIEMNSPT